MALMTKMAKSSAAALLPDLKQFGAEMCRDPPLHDEVRLVEHMHPRAETSCLRFARPVNASARPPQRLLRSPCQRACKF